MNLARPKVIRQAWDLAQTRVGSPVEQEALERIPLVKSSLILASEDPQGRSANPSQVRRAVDGVEQTLCIGKDWRLSYADFSQREGARGYSPSLRSQATD